jgi:hypothetical protein
MINRVLWTLSAEGPRGFKLADIICDLVVKAGQLGELEPCEIAVGGVAIAGKRAPRQWFERLGKAIETEAIDYLDADRIVEILLQGRP